MQPRSKAKDSPYNKMNILIDGAAVGEGKISVVVRSK
jgi:hypothetical protein